MPNNNDHAGDGDGDRDHKPKDAVGEALIRGPIFASGALVGYLKREYATKEGYARRYNAFRCAYLELRNTTTSNHVIAWFTVFLFLSSLLQWDAARRQSNTMLAEVGEMKQQTAALIKTNEIANSQAREMSTQTESLIEQTKLSQRQLEQAEKASVQTDRVLEQTRLEQRAWLSISGPTIEPLKINEPIRYAIPVRNSGHTPATIISGAVKAYVLAPTTDRNTIEEDFERTEPLQDIGTLVAPDGVTRLEMKGDEGAIWLAEYDKGVKDGALQVFIIGRFIYMDAFQLPHTTKFLFEHESSTNRLLSEGDYGHMD